MRSSRPRDYGLAKRASIGVWGLDFDHSGNLYVADGAHYVVYRISTDGMIERFVGGHPPPDLGDGGLAIDASLVFNRDVAVDQNDNIYIPDVVDQNDNIYIPDVRWRRSASRRTWLRMLTISFSSMRQAHSAAAFRLPIG